MSKLAPPVNESVPVQSACDRIGPCRSAGMDDRAIDADCGEWADQRTISIEIDPFYDGFWLRNARRRCSIRAWRIDRTRAAFARCNARRLPPAR